MEDEIITKKTCEQPEEFEFTNKKLGTVKGKIFNKSKKYKLVPKKK